MKPAMLAIAVCVSLLPHNAAAQDPAIGVDQPPLDTTQVQAVLRPDEIVVAFSLGETRTFRWVLSQEHVIVDRIAGRVAIENASTQLLKVLRTTSNRDAVVSASQQLSEMLFAGISTADDRPLVVIPHGALIGVPFEVLPLQGKMLIERHAVSYAPSLDALAQLRRSPPGLPPLRVLAAGDRDVGQELHAIGRAFRDRTRVVTGPSADGPLWRDGSLSQYPVLHFATPGVLETTEISDLELNARLVVLTGDESIALSRKLLQAGAQSVVAPLWKRDAPFAAAFVARFYRELSQAHAPEEALRRAKMAFTKQARYSHPFYWSALVLLGDGSRPLIDEPIRQSMGLHVLAAGFSVLAIAVAVAKIRNTAQS